MLAPPAELFHETNWFAVLYGQGIEPDDYHPLADAMSEYDLKVRLARIRSGVQDRVDGMPSHQAFIDRHCAARRGRGVGMRPSGDIHSIWRQTCEDMDMIAYNYRFDRVSV